AGCKAEVVDEHDELPLNRRQRRKQRRQGGYRIGSDLDQGDTARCRLLRGQDGRTHQRALTHAPGPPEQYVVRCVPARMAQHVLGGGSLLPIDSAQEIEPWCLQARHGPRGGPFPDVSRGREPVGSSVVFPDPLAYSAPRWATSPPEGWQPTPQE